jgi:hypothetical protein
VIVLAIGAVPLVGFAVTVTTGADPALAHGGIVTIPNGTRLLVCEPDTA